VLSSGYRKCEQEVVAKCRDLLAQRLAYADGDEFLDAAQNARLVAAAQNYIRAVASHSGAPVLNSE
jgi:hypothetical protein